MWEEEHDGVRDIWLGRSNRPSPKQKWRRIGDNLSWKINFSVDGVTKPEMPDTILEYSEMTLSHTNGSDRGGTLDGLIPFYSIIALLFASAALKYQYTYSTILLNLGKRLDELARFELLKLKSELQPENIMTRINQNRAGMDRGLENWKYPSSWIFYDNQLPAWYQSKEHKLLAEN
jgi:hypothetical protein